MNLVLNVVVSTVATTLLGLGGCDTRYPEDVVGVVVDKDLPAPDNNNPSLVVDPDATVDGDEVRVWVKREVWEKYEVGSAYP